MSTFQGSAQITIMNQLRAAHCAAMLLLCASTAFAQGSAKPIATVNGVPIPQKALDQAVQRAVSQGNADSPQLREAVKQQLLARELLVQEATKQNFDKDPEVLAIVDEARRTAMVQRYLRATIKPSPVTEEQVRAQYEQARTNAGPREFKLRVMQLPSEIRAKEILAQINKGKDFAALARQWSVDPSSTRGGEQPDWVTFRSPPQEGQTNNVPLAFAQALDKLPKGKVSEPIALGGTWWLIRLDDVRPTRIPSYDEARPEIYNLLSMQELQRATGELVSRLLKGAKIVQ
jgi:parvulin-like peptidyl-prolyl isomerase